MTINTKRFGNININPETILTFDSGILGFSKFKKYVLIDPNKKSPLKWLQSVESPDLAFVVTDPNIFMNDYEIVVSKTDLEDIELSRAEKSVQLVIVTVPRDPSLMTANLRGPIVINTVKQY